MPISTTALITALVVSLVSAAISIAAGVIGSLLTGKEKQARRRVESPSQARKQNITDTTAYIPILVGEGRIGGSRVFGAVKTAYTGNEVVNTNGIQIEQDTEGNFLYLQTVHGYGVIDDIVQIYLDGVPVTDSKFGNGYKVDLTLSWVYVEPRPITIEVLTPITYGFGAGSFISPITPVKFNISNLVYIPNGSSYGGRYYTRSYVDAIRYQLERRAVGASVWEVVRSFPGGVQSITIANASYGNWEYRLTYKPDDADIVIVGNATVDVTEDNDDFNQPIDNNLTISQNSFLNSEYIQLEDEIGLQTTASSAWLAAGLDGYNAGMVGNRCVITRLRLLKHIKGQRAEKTPIQAIPTVTIDYRGTRVYDPRLDSTNTAAGGVGPQRFNDPTTWEYSANPILIGRYL